MSDNVNVEFGATTGKAEGGINTIKDRLQELSEVATKAFEANQIIEFGEKLAELGHKVVEFAEHFAQMGEAVNRATQILGMSAQEFQQFAFAVKLTGGDADSAVQSMTRFEKNIGEAARGAGEAAPFFKSIGVSMQDLKNGNIDQIINKVADAFHNSADGVEKVATATAIGGRGFAQMIPALNQGAEGMEEFKKKLEETGDALTTLQVHSFQETDDNLKLLSSSFEGLGITLFDALRPAIDNVVTGFTELVEGFNNSLKAGGELRIFFQALVVVIDLVVEAIDFLIQSIRTLYDVTLLSTSNMGLAFETLGQIMLDVLSGNWDKIDDDYNAGMAKIEKNTTETIDRIKDHWSKFGQRVVHAAQGVADMGQPDTKAPGSNKPKIKLPEDQAKAKEAAAERLKIATEEIATEQKLRELDLDDQKDALDAGVRMNLVSEGQKFAALTQFANQAYQIKVDAVNKELQLDNLKASQKKKLYDQLLILEKQHQNQIAQIQRQQQQVQMQRYHQVFAAIDSSFKGMIQGVLQGTQTWKQALGNMFTNLMVSFAGMLEEMAMKWVENQIMMAIFGKTEAMGIISGHAAEGAAAAYASTAAIPIVGPAMAPGAAALAYGNIMAFSALPSFDVGAWQLGADGAAMVHKDEMIVPAGPAQAFREALSSGSGSGGGMMGGKGDTHLHFHGTVVDGKQWFMNNKANIAAALNAAQRGGDTSLRAMQKNQ